jgi:hypothetical protein
LLVPFVIDMTKFLTLVAFSAFLGSPLARAEFATGTYNPAAHDNEFTGSPFMGSDNGANTFSGLAQQFTVTQDIFSLSELTLPLALAPGANPSQFSFEIRSSNASLPTGLALYTADFSLSGIDSTLREVTAAVSPIGSEGLAAGNYWLVLSQSPLQSGPGISWGSVTGSSATTNPSAFSIDNSPWSINPGTTYGMALDGELTPAPEPGQIAMGAILFTCIGGITLYQRKANGRKACADPC